MIFAPELSISHLLLLADTARHRQVIANTKQVFTNIWINLLVIFIPFVLIYALIPNEISLLLLSEDRSRHNHRQVIANTK